MREPGQPGSLLSALVVNHDGAATLERCLASLIPPPGLDLEVIVADCASQDGSQDVVRRRFPEARLLALGENLGYGTAANRAAAEARGWALLLLNHDAWLTPGCLEELARRLAAERDLGLVAPRLAYPTGRPQTAWGPDLGVLGEAVQRLRNRLEGWPLTHGVGMRFVRLLLGPGWFTGACVLVRRTAFEQVGGFDASFFLYFEDADLCLRLRQAGWRLTQEYKARAVHARDGGPKGPPIELAYRRSQLSYYAKHRARWEQALLRAHLRRRYRRRPLPEPEQSELGALLAGASR